MRGGKISSEYSALAQTLRAAMSQGMPYLQYVAMLRRARAELNDPLAADFQVALDLAIDEERRKKRKDDKPKGTSGKTGYRRRNARRRV